MSELIVVLDNIRSAHNVGSILRTCDGFGVEKLIACGVTPYPIIESDHRLPHIAKRANDQIAKTALGAEKEVSINYAEDVTSALNELRNYGYQIWAIEQAKNSIPLSEVKLDHKVAVVFGNEIAGVNQNYSYDKTLEIPMKGAKESFNVSVVAGIVLYQLSQ